MADIFLSYSSQDRPVVEVLARALSERGWSVWWDTRIDSGQQWDLELETQIERARCVVVLWSPNSVKSKWVRDEAQEGLAKKALIPALIGQTKIPFGYRRLQTANLIDWRVGAEHDGFNRLSAGITRALGAPDPNAKFGAPATVPRKAGWFSRHWRTSAALRIASFAAPAIVVAALLVGAMLWRVPTRVQLDLVVDRVKFTVAGNGKTPVLDTLGFSRLTVEKFRSVTFHPLDWAVADPARSDQEGRPREDAWNALAVSDKVSFSGTDRSLRPSFTLQSLDAAHSVGKLDLLMVGSGTSLTMTRLSSARDFSLDIDGQDLAPVAVLSGDFEVEAHHAKAQPRPAFADDALLYRGRLRQHSPEVEITGQQGNLFLKLQPGTDATLDLLPKGGTEIQSIDLVAPNVDARWRSTIVAPGQLSYPDSPHAENVAIQPSDFVGLGEFGRFFVTGLRFDPKREGLSLSLYGSANKIVVKTGPFAEDRRLTVLEKLRLDSTFVFAAGILLGAISLLLTLVNGYREIHTAR
jgi:hypothetical protein